MEEGILDIDLAIDDDGFLDRQCPDERCRRYFKVLHSDWEASDSVVVTCPFCGLQDEPTEFTTVEQEVYLRDIGIAYMQGQLPGLLYVQIGYSERVSRRTPGTGRSPA